MLRRLRLFQFRCHERLEWEPSPGRNFLIGANGLGKTSILEAIYYLGRLRSFRTGQPREMAWSGASVPGFAIEAEQETERGREMLAVKWEDGARTWTIDGNKGAKLEEFWGRLPTVLFSAEDSVLIRGPAAKRQAWLDSFRSAGTSGHLVAVQRYNAILKQRNSWLRQGAVDHAVGDVLTQQLLQQGRVVTGGRIAAANDAERFAAPLLESFFGGTAICRFRYRPSLRGEKEIDWPRLAALEKRQQRTLIGPHRDEWEIAWREKSVARYGSEGEQRLAALLLRLIEAAHLRECRGQWPLFLVDDALTPLDPGRKLTLETLLPPEAQIIQAGTVPPSCPAPGDALWSVKAGTLNLE